MSIYIQNTKIMQLQAYITANNLPFTITVSGDDMSTLRITGNRDLAAGEKTAVETFLGIKLILAP